jgi:hypothetical protein
VPSRPVHKSLKNTNLGGAEPHLAVSELTEDVSSGKKRIESFRATGPSLSRRVSSDPFTAAS